MFALIHKLGHKRFYYIKITVSNLLLNSNFWWQNYAYLFLFKALDQEPTERNRQNTAAAIKPLTEAVENLTTFASSPEFASIPAKISPKVFIIFYAKWLSTLFINVICFMFILIYLKLRF